MASLSTTVDDEGDSTMYEELEQKYFIARFHGTHNNPHRSNTQYEYKKRERQFLDKWLNIIKVTSPGELCRNDKTGWKALWNFAEKYPYKFRNMFNITDGATMRRELSPFLAFEGKRPNESMTVSLGPSIYEWFFCLDNHRVSGIFDIDLPTKQKEKIKKHDLETPGKKIPSLIMEENEIKRLSPPKNLLGLAKMAEDKNKIFNVIIISCRPNASVGSDDGGVSSLSDEVSNLKLSPSTTIGKIKNGGRRRTRKKSRKRKLNKRSRKTRKRKLNKRSRKTRKRRKTRRTRNRKKTRRRRRKGGDKKLTSADVSLHSKNKKIPSSQRVISDAMIENIKRREHKREHKKEAKEWGVADFVTIG